MDRMLDPTDSTMDPFSKMVDLAIFHLRKDASDTELPREIEKLGFKIATFDETEMMVTIKYPSTSVIKKLLTLAKDSEMPERSSQLCPSCITDRKNDEPTKFEVCTNAEEEDTNAFSLLTDAEESNSIKGLLVKNVSQNTETETRNKQETQLSGAAIYSSFHEIQFTYENQKDNDGRAKNEFGQEENCFPRYPENNVQKRFRMREGTEESNYDDQKICTSDDTISSLEKEQTDNSNFEVIPEDEESMNHPGDQRSFRTSSYNAHANSQTGSQDTMTEKRQHLSPQAAVYEPFFKERTISEQDNGCLDQKCHFETQADSIQQQKGEKDGCTERREDNACDTEEQLADQPSSFFNGDMAKYSNEEYHPEEDGNDLASPHQLLSGAAHHGTCDKLSHSRNAQIDNNARVETPLRKEKRDSPSGTTQVQVFPKDSAEDNQEHNESTEKNQDRYSNDEKTFTEEAVPLSNEEETNGRNIKVSVEKGRPMKHHSDQISYETSICQIHANSHPDTLDNMREMTKSKQNDCSDQECFLETQADTTQPQKRELNECLERREANSYDNEKHLDDQPRRDINEKKRTGRDSCGIEEQSDGQPSNYTRPENPKEEFKNEQNDHHKDRNGNSNRGINKSTVRQRDTFDGTTSKLSLSHQIGQVRIKEDDKYVGDNSVNKSNKDEQDWRTTILPNKSPVTKNSQNKEGTITSQNPRGTSKPVTSPNILMTDVNESHELIEMSEPVFRNVIRKFKDSIGLYSYFTSKTGEKMMSVYVKKSPDFEKLTSYVYNRGRSPNRTYSDLPSLAHSAARSSELSDSFSSLPPDICHGKVTSSHGGTNVSHDYFEKKSQGLIVKVERADIMHLPNDVIVCPADRYLQSTSGLQKAVSDNAGRELKDACRKFISECNLLGGTDVLSTPAGDLNAQRVFHAVYPTHGSSNFNEDLKKVVLKCLLLAESKGFKSITFPIINSYTYPDEGCFRNLILSVICFGYFLQRLSQNMKVTFVDKRSVAVETFVKFLKDNVKLFEFVPNLDYNEQNMGNVFMEEIDNIRRSCFWTTPAGSEGLFSMTMPKKHFPSSQMSEASRTFYHECPICCSDSSEILVVPCCNQELCQSCEAKVSECPFCKKRFRVKIGNQPPGTMSVKVSRSPDLPGYNKFGSYVIKYDFPGGYQKAEENHPNPGKKFEKTMRVGYLPYTQEAEPYVLLLILAFMRRITFTIGTSLSTGKPNCITWNGIHHKTSTKINSSHGYPDPHYFNRLEEELKSQGVTENMMTDKEFAEIKVHKGHLRRYFFTQLSQ